MELFLTLMAAGLLSVCLPTASARDWDPKNGFRNLTLGQRDFIYTDTLLFNDTQQHSAIYMWISSNDVCYPKTGWVFSNINITAIKVTDLMPKNQGGFASVKEGGIGQRWVCIHLESQRNKGYYFGINIWGRNHSSHF